MPRLTNLDDLLFPVEEFPVFTSLRTNTSERRLSIPEKKAIVNTKTSRVLSVVSRDYRLVTNREALDWAFQCCQTVFPETKPAEWQITASEATLTGSYCFIDLVHNSTSLDFTFVPAKDRPDAFGPFIRVTNSYNALRALAFDIGFLRKVCRNGLILPDTVIQFKFTHLRRDIGETIRFEIARERLSKLKASFSEYLGVLRDCAVPRSAFGPLFCGVLLIHQPKNMKPYSPTARDWDSLSQYLDALYNRYADELGENAYSVFNAITDFASQPLENKCIHRDRNSFQKLAGNWVNVFSNECRKPDFTLPDYLAKLNQNSVLA